jgi:hypothetical protein
MDLSGYTYNLHPENRVVEPPLLRTNMTYDAAGQAADEPIVVEVNPRTEAGPTTQTGQPYRHP